MESVLVFSYVLTCDIHDSVASLHYMLIRYEENGMEVSSFGQQ